MDKAIDDTLSELERFWQDIVPTLHSEKPCLYRHGQHEQAYMSYKDFYAHAHCAAAYLMNQGLQHNDPVVILSANSADYLILDLALQYLGGINITLPSDIAPEDLVEISRRYDVRFIFVPDAATLRRHNELAEIKSQLQAIVVGTDELEGLETQKLIALDRLVAIGKTAWREGAPLLRDRKHKVRPSDLYALVFPEDGAHGDFEPMTFKALMNNVDIAYKMYGNKPEGALVSLLEPHRILHRSFGAYGSMRSRMPLWIYPAEALDGAFFQKVNPEVIVGSPAQISAIYHNIPALVGKDANAQKKVAKAIQKAHQVLDRKVDAESQGKKNPFFNRLRYRFSNKKTYSKARVGLGGKMTFFIGDLGDIDGAARVFLTECGFKIEQPQTLY
jgi:long-chain acyl-CoA synthetase